MANKIINKKNEIRSKKDTVIRRKLGNILVETGLLSAEKLDEALETQKNSGKRLGQTLIEMKVITEEEMAFALAMQLKIPFIDLSDYAIEQKLLDSIPLEVSRKFLCIPIALNNNILEVAMSDPLDLNTIKDLQFITGYNIQPAISTSTQIAQSLQKHHHPEKTMGQVAEELEDEEVMEFLPEKGIEEEEEDHIEMVQDSPFVKMVDLIIRNAIKRGASDVHIEAQENQV
jgi:type IV pilus assembly protein PilB